MMGYYGYGYSNMMGYFGGGVMMLVVLAALILFVIWIVKELTRGDKNSGRVIEILRERYAKGEINKEEFEQKKKDLGY